MKNSPINIHVFTAFLSCMGVGVVFMNLPPVLPELRTTYGVSYARIGFLIASLVLAHASVQIPSGLITDLIGTKKSLLGSLTLILISSLLCVFNTDYYFVLSMRILSGIGTGFAFISGMKYAAMFTSPTDRGFVQGVFGGSFSIGGIIPFLLMPMLVHINWKLIYLTTAAFFAIPILCLIIWGKEMPSQGKIQLTQFKPIFRNKAIWMLGILHAIFFGGVLTMSTWFSAFITSVTSNNSLSWAGAWGGLMMLISGIARFMGGGLLKRFTPLNILIYTFLILSVSYLTLCWLNNLPLLFFFFGLAIFMSSVTFGPIFYLSTLASKMELAASGFGIVNFIANLGSFLFPIAFGYLIDITDSYTASFIFMTVLSIMGASITYFLKSLLPKDPHSQGSKVK